MDDLLRLAEDAAIFMDVENVRVCFPLCVEQGECLILLDGINEVPLPETWHAMQELDLVDTVSPPKSNELNSSISQCGDLVFLDDAVHTTPSLTDNDTTSDVQVVCNSTPPTPAHTYVCSKRLFTPAEGELGADLSSSGSTIAHVVARSPSPLEDIGTGEANSVFVNGKDGAEQAEVTTSSIDLLPSVDIITTCPTLPSFESFREEHTDRLTWLSNSKSFMASDNQKVVYYHVAQCFKTKDNFALRAAMLLSVQLNLPLVALVIVECDVVADARSSIPPSQSHPHCDHHRDVDAQGVSLGNKRKIDETTSCTTDFTLPQGSVEAKATQWNHRDVALRGLRRKSGVRMTRIARLKKELAELHIPLLVIEYDPSRPRLKTLHTNSASAIKDQQVSSNKASVTPHLRTSLSNPAQVELESSHPIAQILISLCARGVNSMDSEKNDQNVSAIATVTPGPQILNNQDEYMSMHSTLYKTSFNQEYSPSLAQGVQGVQEKTKTIASAAACAAVLVTDGLLHPLQRYVHRAVTAALPTLPLVAVDSSSCSLIARNVQNKTNNVSTALSFEQFCTASESQKDSDSSVAAPSLQELSKHLPQHRAAEFSRSIEKALFACPYGTLLNDVPVMEATSVFSTEVTTSEVNLHEEYGRYLCSVLAEDIELINTNNNNNDGSSGEPSANIWSVPWLDLLPSRAARTVQDIDTRLRELRVKNDNKSAHYRQEVLQSLYAGTTKCVTYNTIMYDLYEKGSIIACESLTYWIVYCMYRLYSATQAIQFTYTMLATQSVEDFMCCVSQVSLYVHALREVLNDIGDNLPVGNVGRVETYFGNVLSKLANDCCE